MAWTTPAILITLFLFWATWPLWRFFSHPREKPTFRSVAILVLGDIGRSPRMMYHAESFAKIQFDTFLIGYQGSKPVPSLTVLPHVHFLYLSEPPAWIRGFPFILIAPIKIAHQITTILTALLIRIEHPPEFILVQNPPSIPTLALVWLVGWLRGSKVIIDWHNLGYSILAMRLGQGHLFVKIAKKFEAFFGKTAFAHLFVTQAMHDHLVSEWGLKGYKIVLHDRPPSHFHRSSPSEIHELFLRLNRTSSYTSLTSFVPPFTPPFSTPFTHIPPSNLSPLPATTNPWPSSQATIPNPRVFTTPKIPTYGRLDMPTLRPDRPALLVSSTSWTPDEDFGILIKALEMYEAKAREVNSAKDSSSAERRLPEVLVVLTGKGPLKKRYMEEVGRLQWAREGQGESAGWLWVRCISLWLEAEDYPLLLGSADLGVCLHSSSSALDLPMKIVDMFGCGLPVCALNFKCLPELVKDGKNGLIFDDAAQLASQLEILFTNFPASPALGTLRTALVDEQRGWGSWDENWTRTVRPLVLRDVAKEVRLS